MDILTPTESPSSTLAGRCDVIGIATLLTMFQAQRMTGLLRITRVNPVEDGLIYLVSGNVHRAELRPREDLRGLDAVVALMSRSDGMFEFTRGSHDVTDEVRRSTTQILVEAARRMDAAREGP